MKAYKAIIVLTAALFFLIGVMVGVNYAVSKGIRTAEKMLKIEFSETGKEYIKQYFYGTGGLNLYESQKTKGLENITLEGLLR